MLQEHKKGEEAMAAELMLNYQEAKRWGAADARTGVALEEQVPLYKYIIYR